MADYNLSQRTNFNFLNFKPTRIICISNLPQNMTQDWIRRQMKEHYGNDVVVRLQGTSWDILFCNVSEATTALSFEHGANWQGCNLSATFLPEDCIATLQTVLEQQPEVKHYNFVRNLSNLLDI